jgi:Spy/CpxP family protein refolding chaperone
MATASLVTLVTLELMPKADWNQHDQADGHLWLHEELGLTAEEAAAIDQFESPYREERSRLNAEFEKRIDRLASLLRESDGVTPEVTHAVHELHSVHGQLQELSIRHYFEMLSVLPPEKQAKLRQLAVEALSTPL